LIFTSLELTEILTGGLGGSDIVVIAKTFFTTDFTGIAENTLQKVAVCTAGLI
jgi:hypothetical protein